MRRGKQVNKRKRILHIIEIVFSYPSVSKNVKI